MNIDNIKIKVIIDNTESMDKEITWEDNKLTLIFPNGKSLKHFLKTDELIKLNNDTLNQDELNKLSNDQNELNKIIKDIKEKITKATIIIYNYLEPEEITFLANKTEVIYDLTNLSITDELQFLKSFPIPNNFLFKDKYNGVKEKNYLDLTKAYEKILQAGTILKKLNLSPAEYTFLVYDLVRERKPLKGKKEISRDLTNVLNSEEIVCLGYINIFNALLELLGIFNEKLEWNSKNENDLNGHVDSLVYLNDSKYDIHCLTTFDPTWDSYDNYLANHCYFSFLPILADENYKDRSSLILIPGTKYYFLKKGLERIKKLKDLETPEVIVINEINHVINLLQEIYNRLGKELPSLNILQDLDILEELINSLDKELISLTKVRKIITTVRQVENNLKQAPSDEETINSLVSSTYSNMYEQYMHNMYKSLSLKL